MGQKRVHRQTFMNTRVKRLFLLLFLLLLIPFLLSLVLRLEKFYSPVSDSEVINHSYILVGPLGQSKHKLIDKTSGKPNTVKKRRQPQFIPQAGFKSAILGSVWTKSTSILNSVVAMMLREGPRQCASRCVLLHRAFRIQT